MELDPTVDLLIAFLTEPEQPGEPMPLPPRATDGLVMSFEEAMQHRAERRARLAESHD